jgi:hypothetical protein
MGSKKGVGVVRATGAGPFICLDEPHRDVHPESIGRPLPPTRNAA